MSKKSKKKNQKSVTKVKSVGDINEIIHERMEEAYNEQAAEDARVSKVLTASSNLIPTKEEIEQVKRQRVTKVKIDVDNDTREEVTEEQSTPEPQQVEMKLAASKGHVDPEELKEELDKEVPAEEEVELAKYPMKSCVGIISDGFMYRQDPKTYGTYHWIENEHSFGNMCQTIPERKDEIAIALINKGFVTEEGELDDTEILKKYLEEYKVPEKIGKVITSKMSKLDEEFKEIVIWEIRYALLLKTTEKTKENIAKFEPAPECVYRPADIVKLLAA